MGNRIEIVGYDNIQFTKAPHVLRSMGLADLGKSPQAIKELADKRMAPIDAMTGQSLLDGVEGGG